MQRKLLATVFFLGLISLMYELLQVRMFAFFLAASVDFIAIPIALMGLTLGSMYRHYAYPGDDETLIRVGSQALLPTMAVSLVGFFVVANGLFPDIHVRIASPGREAISVLVYSTLFLPPYLLVGALLTSVFAAFPERIGRLYFFDLAGASLGCVLGPLVLTFLGLRPALIVLLGLSAGLGALHSTVANRRWAIGGLGVLMVTTALGVTLTERPDPRVLASTFLSPKKFDQVDELDARWNEVARTALLRGEGRATQLAIVQDNGVSNVKVRGYGRPHDPDVDYTKVGNHGLPWLLDDAPTSFLVMFAGIGRDMVVLDRLGGGQASIVGVEINPTIAAWIDNPRLEAFRLREFVDRPEITYVNAEGRDFLNRDDRTYDFIFVANNGATYATRTGHARKFLDTREALDAYRARLAPHGAMLFVAQTLEEKLPVLREWALDQGSTSPEQTLFAFGPPRHPEIQSVLFKPSGFSQAEIVRLEKAVAGRTLDRLLYAPGQAIHEPIAAMIEGRSEGNVVSDDQPFLRGIPWGSFSLVPDPERQRDPWYVSGWVKLFTLLVFGGVAAVVGAIAIGSGTAARRVPAAWVIYLTASGVGYMCIQIGLIAKTELIVGNPLYAIAVNLAGFLVANALGANLVDRAPPWATPVTLVTFVIVGVAWGLGTVELFNATLLSWPLVLKIGAVLVAIAPVGLAVGMFYPYCVGTLSRTGQAGAVGMTYALATLSSVLGSSLAMTLIIDLGFSRVIGLGCVAYLGAGLLAWIAVRR